jgi:hypothetical protein
MLKAGETYGQEAFSGSKHHESRSSASESTPKPPKSPKSPVVEPRESFARDTAKSTSSGKLEGVAFVFRGTVEREGKELAFFDIVRSDDKVRSSGREEEGQAAQAKDRSGGALRSGAFQDRSDNCGSAAYNVKDGLIEQLSVTHSSRSASQSGLQSESGREEEAAETRNRSSKEDEPGLTLLIRRIDGSAGITPEKSTGSSDRDDSN